MLWNVAVIAGLALLLGVQSAYGQAASVDETLLATVNIRHSVLANGQPLEPGRYGVHLTDEWVDPLEQGEQQGMRWVEFRTDSRAVGREAALVIPASSIDAVSAWHPARGTSRVDLLRTGDFVRIWVNRQGTNYLIHLPVSMKRRS